MNEYEGIFIVKPTMKDEEAAGVFKVVMEGINKNGGTIKKEENWGKKPLVYPVKKFREGYYYKLDFSAPPSSIAKLEDAYRLNADILRTMITRK